MTTSTDKERFSAVIEAIRGKDSHALIVALAALATPSWGPVPPATPKECKEAIKRHKNLILEGLGDGVAGGGGNDEG